MDNYVCSICKLAKEGEPYISHGEKYACYDCDSHGTVVSCNICSSPFDSHKSGAWDNKYGYVCADCFQQLVDVCPNCGEWLTTEDTCSCGYRSVKVRTGYMVVEVLSSGEYFDMWTGIIKLGCWNDALPFSYSMCLYEVYPHLMDAQLEFNLKSSRNKENKYCIILVEYQDYVIEKERNFHGRYVPLVHAQFVRVVEAEPAPEFDPSVAPIRWYRYYLEGIAIPTDGLQTPVGKFTFKKVNHTCDTDSRSQDKCCHFEWQLFLNDQLVATSPDTHCIGGPLRCSYVSTCGWTQPIELNFKLLNTCGRTPAGIKEEEDGRANESRR